MTEAEHQMMNTIHAHGLIFSMDDDTVKQVMDRMKAIMKEAAVTV